MAGPVRPVTVTRPRPAKAVKAPPMPEPAPAARAWWHRVPVELVVLAFLAFTTRLAFVTSPRAIVFDEVYFREYALRYREGTFFFDIHPPLGKLLLAGWAKMFGVSATVSSKDPAVALRVLPAIAGSLIVVVFYLFLRELTASRRVATLGAALILLDNAFLLESRLILLDSMLLLFGFGAITCYLAAQRRTGRAHWVLLTCAAALAGMAVSTKWTGLSALGLIGTTWLGRTIRDRVHWRRALPQVGVLLGVPALIYVLAFAVHFSLLTHSGPGDAYMSQKFQSTLVGDKLYDPKVHMSFPERLIESNEALHRYDLSLNNATHPYSSTWASWPAMKRGVYYWTDATKTDGKSRYLYLLGNPLIWWGLIAGAVVTAIGWLLRPERFARHKGVLAFLAVGWAASYLPFLTIKRPMFLYHYFFAFMFSLAAVVIGIGLLAGWMTGRDGDEPEPAAEAWTFPTRASAGLYWGILSVALLAFLYFAPLSYGLPLSDSGLAHRMWRPTWR